MPQSRYPRNYADAVEEFVRPKHDYRKSGVFLAASDTSPLPDFIKLVDGDGIPFVAFNKDGRVKICTMGRNTFTTVFNINAALPEPYRVRRLKSGLALIDGRRQAHPAAIFLSSTTFLPKSQLLLAANRPEEVPNAQRTA